MDCPNCGTKNEMPNIPKYKKNYKKKKWFFIIVIALFYIGGILLIIKWIGNVANKMSRYNGTLHQYEDFIDYVDNLECNINDKKYSCNLKDKYEVVNEETGYDDGNKETKTLTFKIKNTDLEFSVKSAYQCTSHFDASCLKYTYLLTDDFKETAFNYYIVEYNKMIDYNNEYCYQLTDNCVNGWFKIKTYSDLEYVINYMNGFLDYINKLEFKFVCEYGESFNINFDKAYENNEYYNSISIYFDVVDNKYTYEFEDEYKPEDGTIETYIKNYMNAKGITLE